MFKIILALSFILNTNIAIAKTGMLYDTKILRVIDGDTVVIAAPYLPQPLKPELAVRIYGIDTPEKGHRAHCMQEVKQGKKASLFTKQMVETNSKQQIILYDWDKYGGRVLGDIILDGKSLRVMLIQNGFAREYYGELKQTWCKK